MHLIDVIGGRDGPRCGKRATHRASGKGAAQGNKRQTQGLTTQGSNGELRDERISASCVGVPACLPGSECGVGGRAETEGPPQKDPATARRGLGLATNFGRRNKWRRV